jgi:endonuclease/exonuclease/phosphatase (EEP) superfamily protein YafD
VRRLVAIVVALPWVVWAVARTLGVELPFPLVAALAFTPYAALTSPLPVVVALALRRRGVALVSALAALALGLAMVPRAVAGPRPDADGPRLVVMTSNLFLGRADVGPLLRIAREHDVDVLSLQELRPEQMTKLDAVGGRAQFPYRTVDPGQGAVGIGVLSRLPAQRSGAVAPELSVVVPGAPPVTIRAVHPAPPVRPSAAGPWRATIAALPGSDSRGDVRILAGDFNATLDHPELRSLLDRGYTDAADAAGAGFTWTWPARPRGHTPKITIDHVLVDRRVRVESVTAVRVPNTDHRALIAVLRLPHG